MIFANKESFSQVLTYPSQEDTLKHLTMATQNQSI